MSVNGQFAKILSPVSLRKMPITVFNILIKLYRHIDIDKIEPKGLQNAIYHWSRLCRDPNSENVKMALSLELSEIL